ncbi:SusC/RagA family TonB-linked outer membrane protein [Tenacibaculum jejuense]|uniref:SusC-like TonB-dependent outer membrane receptor n=1 Tax=Tenacibaculum jejuense TaxID=584609 RepID=A0A238UAM0_9FLAO|nr:SusC/RagA family TonB-linked outer membrane protein [Tenacibaculum jejuense]SNR16125.1 SusC-like TonB-dependent outer membrane receptor precursor [Tenacibaculum jejuense]
MKGRLTIVLVFLVALLYAQETVKGTVLDANTGEVLPGVGIMIKNTTKGTSTDFDGKFSLKVNKGQILQFSFIGFKTQELVYNGQGFLKVLLEEDNAQLEEVIVTSLGIKKEKRALGYAATELKANELTKVKTPNVLNALAGKVAGLQVTGANNGVASSARVVIRGENSLNINSNQPLFILDGVPVNNRIFGVGGNTTDQADLPTDYGNGLSELNADDFASVTILKGAAASALYGSRAANGVVVITTKKGSQYDEGIGLEISSSSMFSSALRLPELQTQFGGGWAGAYASNFGTNFGPALNGAVIPHELSLGEVVNRPFINRYDLNDFFKQGVNLDNTVTLSGGNEKGDFLFSYGNTYNEGIVPNTNLRGNSFRINAGYKLSEKLTANVRANYVTRGSDNLTVAGYGNQGIMYALLWNYINVDLNELKDYWRVENQEQRRLFTWGDNPWFIANENINAFDKNRFVGNVSLTYDFNDNLSLLGRVGIDQSNDFRWSRRSIGAVRNPNGMYREQEIDFSEINADFLLTYKRNFGENFTTTTSVGANRFDQQIQEGFLQGNGLSIPGLYNAQNINVTPVIRSNLFKKRINSVYAFTNLGYKDYLFLDLSVRNDWSSTLPSDNNSYFYPAASVSFIPSSAFELPEVIDFLKLRFNVAEVGKDTDPYSLFTAYEFGTLGGTLTNPSQLLNANLKPERTISTEFGLEGVFLSNRVKLDATYYTSTSRDQILNVGISGANGFNSIVANAGEIKNSGVELGLGITPVRTDNMNWTINANFTKNRSEVVSLLPNLDTFIIGQGPDGVTVEARPGGQMGDIYGDSFIRNDNGDIIYENGLPLTGNRRKVGNYNPDWMLGLGTSFTYKGFNLSAQFDIREGGEIYSYTNAIGRESGILANTLSWRDGIVGEGVVRDDSGGFVPNTQEVTAEAWAYAIPRSNAEANIFDASFVKLRQLSLGYTFSQPVVEKLKLQGLSISLVGSNLFLWTGVPNIDPEAQGLNGGTLLPGFEVTQLPSTRSYGFKVNMKL